jgi:DNA/RNA endonuclease YhcR with UshA esterase domain
MRALIFAVCSSLLAGPAFAVDTIAPCDAGGHVGQTVTIAGSVSEIHHSASGRAIFLHMGGSFPGNCFTAVVFKDDFTKFPGMDSLRGKNIEVSGAVKLYQNKPEIILNDPGQIKAK